MWNQHPMLIPLERTKIEVRMLHIKTMGLQHKKKNSRDQNALLITTLRAKESQIRSH
ncbi:hypothetical protein JHK84_051266 [Glycine max]|nr:hypothetical protein JHK84_051266 [Glycine max]